MPTAAPKPCRFPGCGHLVADGGWCEKHKRASPGSFSDKSRGTRHQRGYGTAWDKLRLIILRRDNGLCQPCLKEGRVTAATHVDHILNKAAGGADAESNLQAICAACHRAKTDKEKLQGRGA